MGKARDWAFTKRFRRGGFRAHGTGLTSLDIYIAIWKYRAMAILNDASLNLTFGALADPTRRAILARLAKGGADVSELMRPFKLSQPTISKHLAVLERAGLVTRGRDAQRRPRVLVGAPLKEVADWIEPFREAWEARFSQLDKYLESMPTEQREPKPRSLTKKAKSR
jgi:DNA-binding transcriptional ArsR family regulator